jgi:hypothetical protein
MAGISDFLLSNDIEYLFQGRDLSEQSIPNSSRHPEEALRRTFRHTCQHSLNIFIAVTISPTAFDIEGETLFGFE